MRKFVVVAGMLGLIAIVPSLAQADRGDHPGAVRFCAFQRDRIGVSAFHARYGRHPFAKCVRRHVGARFENLRDARADCSAERSLVGVAAFRAKYANARDRNAFNRCVSVHQADERAADSAARAACTSQRSGLGERAFREFWGVGANDRLAFDRCVEGTEQDTDSPTPQS
jgi:hypothetical protein